MFLVTLICLSQMLQARSVNSCLSRYVYLILRHTVYTEYFDFVLDLESDLASAAVPDCDDVVGFDLAARLVICKTTSPFILVIVQQLFKAFQG